MKINSDTIVLETPTFKVARIGHKGVCVFYSGLYVSFTTTVMQTIAIIKSLQNASGYPPYDLKLSELNALLKFSFRQDQFEFANKICIEMLVEKELLQLREEQIQQLELVHGPIVQQIARYQLISN